LQAFDRLEVAEMTAMSLVLAQQLGTVAPMSGNDIETAEEDIPQQGLRERLILRLFLSGKPTVCASIILCNGLRPISGASLSRGIIALMTVDIPSEAHQR
jgi:hypothetical protein